MRDHRIALMSDLPESRRTAARRGNRAPTVLWIVLAIVLLVILAVAWVGVRGVLAKGHLENAVADVQTLRTQLTGGDTASAGEDGRAPGGRSRGGPLVDRRPDLARFGARPVLRHQPSCRPADRRVVVDDVTQGAVSRLRASSASSARDSFAPKNGKVDLQPLVQAQAPVAKATATIDEPSRTRTHRHHEHAVPVTSAVNQLRNA